MIRNILLVGAGGSVGSVARYLCQRWIYHLYPHPFPWGTLVVNLSGCFLIGAIYSMSEKSSLFDAELRLLLITGLCGGFTTFSTFAFENVTLLRSGNITYFLLYTFSSLVLGILAVLGGIGFIKLL